MSTGKHGNVPLVLMCVRGKDAVCVCVCVINLSSDLPQTHKNVSRPTDNISPVRQTQSQTSLLINYYLINIVEKFLTNYSKNKSEKRKRKKRSARCGNREVYSTQSRINPA